MNLKKEIKNLRGLPFEMSFPTAEDIEEIKKEKNITQVEKKDLPRETIQNVLINCLATYAVRDKKEVFLVQTIASWVIDESEEKGELKDKLQNFIIKQLLPDSTFRKVETENDKEPKTAGIYTSWVIAQIYNEFGVENAEE